PKAIVFRVNAMKRNYTIAWLFRYMIRSPPMSYDKAKYHFDSVIEEGLPLSQAYIHTGFYLGWLIDNNLLDEEFKEDLAESLALFTRREITAPQLFEEFDGT